MRPIRLALAQINPTVGALRRNRERMEERIRQARGLGVSMLAFPELALSGYPPEDLLTNPEFVRAARTELEALVPASRGMLVLVGAPLRLAGVLSNAAALLLDGAWVDTYAKGSLPNYGVFDEKRYFRPGLRCPVYYWGELSWGLSICEDIWVPEGVVQIQAQGGAQLLVNISSSPYYAGKGREREALMRRRAGEYGAALAYVNLVGGQDELVFDGESLFVDAAGTVRARAPQFEESLLVVDLQEDWLDPERARRHRPAVTAEPLLVEELPADRLPELREQFYLERRALEPPPMAPAGPLPLPAEFTAVHPRLSEEAEIYRALSLGLADYVAKNGFAGVVLGLSGGIDSALTACLAADALGPEKVTGVSMPSRYNSATSQQGARDVAQALGIRFLEIPIEQVYQSYLQTLGPVFAGAAPDATEENIQARIRGNLLMALSNKWGSLVLTTGNKSELAVGYCTLYGDMAGGFAVIKDVPKTLVYKLARYRNRLGPAIPEDTLTRPPSAELKEDQTDQDRLPPYELLDTIVEARMESELDLATLASWGLDPHWVETVYRWMDANEYKRRQAPPGIKITPRAFGRDRRYPITNRWSWNLPKGNETGTLEP